MTEVQTPSSPPSAISRALPVQFLCHLLLGVMLAAVLVLVGVVVLAFGESWHVAIVFVPVGIVIALAACGRSALARRHWDWVLWIAVLTLASWASGAVALLAFWYSVALRPIPVRWHLPGIGLVLILAWPVLAVLAGRSGKEPRAPARWWFKAAGIASGLALSAMWAVGLGSLSGLKLMGMRLAQGELRVRGSAIDFELASDEGPTPTTWEELAEYGGHSRASEPGGEDGVVFLCEHLGRIVRADFAKLPGAERREILRRIDPGFGSEAWPGDACLFWWPSFRPGDDRYFPAAWRGGRPRWLTEAELEASIADLVRRAQAVADDADGGDDA